VADDAQEINAYYNPLNNEIVFPAAICSRRSSIPTRTRRSTTGDRAVIGHEIGHGFDDQGRKFGPDGSLKDWWTQKDADVFKGRVSRLVEQFSAFEALPGLKVNGANTIGENIGTWVDSTWPITPTSCLEGTAGAGDRRANR